MLNKVKQGLQRPLIAHIENAQWGLEQWGFIVTYNVIAFLLKVCTPPPSITELLNISKNRPVKQVRFLGSYAAKHLIWMVVVCVILTFLLLLLMPLVALYAVERLLQLSQQGLTYLRTRR